MGVQKESRETNNRNGIYRIPEVGCKLDFAQLLRWLVPLVGCKLDFAQLFRWLVPLVAFLTPHYFFILPCQPVCSVFLEALVAFCHSFSFPKPLGSNSATFYLFAFHIPNHDMRGAAGGRQPGRRKPPCTGTRYVYTKKGRKHKK